VKSPVLFQLLLPEGMEFGRFEVRPDEAEYVAARKIFDVASRTSLKKNEMLRAVEEELRKIAV
ncbi:MAG TPA: hypothetical protein VLJ39_00525, partial [Tepidisphaeraceae bacterium]|nr:hypothetical protein [Tepidisphaeraceae bacterium]